MMPLMLTKRFKNLMKRSNQVDFNKDESQQIIGYWPSPEYLRQRTVLEVNKGDRQNWQRQHFRR